MYTAFWLRSGIIFRLDNFLHLFSVCFLSLQNAGDVESTLNILNVLDELLSAGKLRSDLDHLIAFDMAIPCRGLTVFSPGINTGMV